MNLEPVFDVRLREAELEALNGCRQEATHLSEVVHGRLVFTEATAPFGVVLLIHQAQLWAGSRPRRLPAHSINDTYGSYFISAVFDMLGLFGGDGAKGSQEVGVVGRLFTRRGVVGVHATDRVHVAVVTAGLGYPALVVVGAVVTPRAAGEVLPDRVAFGGRLGLDAKPSKEAVHRLAQQGVDLIEACSGEGCHWAPPLTLML